MQGLSQVSEDDEIAFLYSKIKDNPNFLLDFEKQQFADTPQHEAAGGGRTRLALEIQRLMPSFGRKQNPDGFSPIDLALERGHHYTAWLLIKADPQLIYAKGREGITPLHWAAKESSHTDMLAEFLLMCPNSIEELTTQRESALHVAVRSGNVEAVMILLGWLKRTGREHVLKWGDWSGNNALHMAAYNNHPQVMEMLLEAGARVNGKNFKGLTALDIISGFSDGKDTTRALQILLKQRRPPAKSGLAAARSKPLFASSDRSTVASYLGSNMHFLEHIIKLLVEMEFGMPSEMRNSILVVAVLIATATFQTALSPPGGFRDNNAVSTNTTSSTPTDKGNDVRSYLFDINYDVNGNGNKVAMSAGAFVAFSFLNSIAFATSLGTIMMLLPIHKSLLLCGSMYCTVLSYMLAIGYTSPNSVRNYVVWPSFVVFIFFMFGITLKRFISKQLPGGALSVVMGNKYLYSTNELLTRVFQSKYSQE